MTSLHRVGPKYYQDNDKKFVRNRQQLLTKILYNEFFPINSFAINLKRKNRYRVSFRTEPCETRAKLKAKTTYLDSAKILNRAEHSRR